MVGIPISAYPLHYGHTALFKDAKNIFPGLHVAFLIADNSKKEYVYDRMRFFQENKEYPAYKVDGLVGKYCNEHDVNCLVRGIRDSSDFEYERRLAEFNFENFGVRTVFIPAGAAVQYISGTAIRELIKYGEFQRAASMCPTGMQYGLDALDKYYINQRKGIIECLMK